MKNWYVVTYKNNCSDTYLVSPNYSRQYFGLWPLLWPVISCWPYELTSYCCAVLHRAYYVHFPNVFSMWPLWRVISSLSFVTADSLTYCFVPGISYVQFQTLFQFEGDGFPELSHFWTPATICGDQMTHKYAQKHLLFASRPQSHRPTAYCVNSFVCWVYHPIYYYWYTSYALILQTAPVLLLTSKTRM